MSWLLLIALLALFVALHCLPFRRALRHSLQERFGGQGYKIGYAILSMIGLFGAFSAVGLVPLVVLWPTTDAARWLALLATAMGFVLLGAAYGPGDGSRFARHPMLAGMALWAGGHVLANGDVGHLFVFGALAVYSVTAMLASDARAAARDPKAFAAIAASTSLVPFRTLLQGRRDGLHPAGPIAGLIAWAAFIALHPWLFGVQPLPATFG